MTKEYDFSTTDILDHNFSFSKMSEDEISKKKQEFETFQSAKNKGAEGLPEIGKKAAAKPMIKPRVKPSMKAKPETSEKPAESEKSVGQAPQEGSLTPPKKVKPVFKPRIPKKK